MANRMFIYFETSASGSRDKGLLRLGKKSKKAGGQSATEWAVETNRRDVLKKEEITEVESGLQC